jgi:tripartite-type tricarboxylate transporter receptor subunit TctC
VYSNLPYDIQRDFAPVSQVAIAPNVMVINPSVPANSVAEFIAYAKSQPGKLSYASGGNGSSAHMSMELFKAMAGVDLQHIPYKGSSPALTDLIGGQVAVFIGNMPPTVPHIKAGKLRALAVTTKSRSALMPELPTIGDTLPGYETVAWFGVLAPAGTPPAALQRLEAELHKAMATPAIKERLAAMGAMPGVQDAAGFTQLIKNEIKRWAPKPGAAGAAAATTSAVPVTMAQKP